MTGVVQGVGFRPCVYNIATGLGLAGYVRNNGSNVEVVLDSDHKKFIERLKRELPPLAKIENITIENSDDVDMANYEKFTILMSRTGARSSVIPADSALCDNCEGELFSRSDRRFLYPFINCTDCGARYSLIKDVPYDRPKTSMAGFDMCPSCLDEYKNPGNRRFHAQTTACPFCGPKFILYDTEGNVLETNQEKCFRKFAKSMNDGKVGVMKSWGGMHICGNFASIPRMRELYRRPEKAFAVMMRDMDAVRRYTRLTPADEELLTSLKRPIVLLKKRNVESEIMEMISPGLDTVGVMLPYSPAHLLLFRYFSGDGIVATSANLPGEPICIDNEKSFDLGLDYYLLHDRGIVQRVDDSVIRTIDENLFYLRKSRSYVPDPIDVDYGAQILSVGAEENVVTAISKRHKIFLSQYIGNTKKYDTLLFLEEATEHMCGLLGIEKLDCVARDLHPGYATRAPAGNYAKRFDCEVLDVQHHWAHAASLAIDNEIDERIVALALDGSGYGPDETIWGGEILESSFEEYKRIGRLEHIPLLGGDKAIRDVRRLVFAISEMTGGALDFPNYSDTEKDIFSKMLPKSILTSSTGRVLDALSSHLNICHYRSYDGEPAMKLEKLLYYGQPKYEFNFENSRGSHGVIDTISAFQQLFDHGAPDEMSFKLKCDLAHSYVSGMMGEMIALAAEHAASEGIKYIGVTGGVSYNEPIIRMIQGEMKKYPDLSLLLHHRLPNGDGGISAGQNVIAGNKKN